MALCRQLVLYSMKKKIKEWFFPYGKKGTLSNVTVNYFFSPVYFLIILGVTHKGYGLPINKEISLWNAGFLSVLSLLVYLYTSTFFQPDLDQDKFRPGKHAFPFGSFITNIPLGSLLRDFVKPVTFLWYWAWHPFALLFTHRGAPHWPIMGTWLRVWWLWLIFILIESVFIALGKYPMPLVYVYSWIKAFFPWNPEFGTIGFWAFCFPVYVGDIFHIIVDYAESTIKGSPFCSPLHRRGLIFKIFSIIRRMPSKFKKHLENLR